MILSIDKVDSLKRKDGRDRVVRYFTQDRMVKNYETVLLQICADKPSFGKRAARNTVVTQKLRKLSERIVRPNTRKK